MEEDDPMSDEQWNILQDGLKAEKTICNSYENLIYCMNPVGKECWQKPLIHPCKKSFEKVMRNLLQDYIDFVNGVQRYSKFNSEYCLWVDKNGTQYCRFHYLIDESPVKYIKYNKVSKIAYVSFRPEIVAERNYPRLNRH